MGRFSHRPKWLARRAEREVFNRMVMPAAYICLPVAVAILFAAVLSHSIYDVFPRDIFYVGLAVFLIPAALALFRFLRGHFSASLDEP